MIVNNLVYEHPYAAFWVFGALLILILYGIYYQYKQKILRYFSKDLFLEQTSGLFLSKVIALALGWIFLILALMGPKGNPTYPQESSRNDKNVQASFNLRRKAHEYIFMFDTSSSMKVKDGRNGQSRLDFAKDIADEVISLLQGGETGSIYTFTSEVNQQVPATMDYFFLRMMLRNLTYNEGNVLGTSLKAALAYFSENYLQKPSNELKTLLLFSDGGDNELDLLSENQKEVWMEQTANVLNHVSNAHVRVIAIGMGTRQGGVIPDLTYEGERVSSHLEDLFLKKISLKGDGRYFESHQRSSYALAKEILNFVAQDDPYEDSSKITQNVSSEWLIYKEYFQYPLILAILLLLYGLFYPESSQLKKLCVIFALSFLPLQGEIYEQWKEPMRQAENYYEAGDYVTAKNIYENLIGFSMPEDQRNVLLYNLALILKAQKKNSQAQSIVDSLLKADNLSDYLENHLYFLKLNILFNSLKSYQTKKSFTFNDLQKAKSLLKDIQKTKALLEEAHCRLEKYEGYPTCRQPHLLTQIYQESKNILLDLIQNYYRQFNTENIQEFIAQFNEAIQKMQGALAILQKNPSKEIHQFIIDQLEEWILQLYSYQMSISSASIQDQFSKLKEFFSAALTHLKSKNYIEAKASFNQAKKALFSLGSEGWKTASLSEFLLFIHNYYESDLLEIDLIVSTQSLWNEIFRQLNVPSIDPENFQKQWKAIQEGFQKTQKMYQEAKNETAQFIYKETLNKIKILSIEANEQLKDYEKTLLKMIQTQNFLALIPPSVFKQLSETVNQTILKNIQLFNQQTINAQIVNFDEHQKCQFHPWDEVIPSFTDGGNQALSGDLTQSKESWEVTYQLLKAPFSEESCHGNSENKASANQQNPQEVKNITGTLEMLQLMENEDKQSQETVPSKQQEGLRPW